MWPIIDEVSALYNGKLAENIMYYEWKASQADSNEKRTG